MYQKDRGSYKQQQSLGSMFLNSCMGKLVILGAFIGIMLLIAHLTIPSEETMTTEMTDNIRQCIEANDSIQTDGLDDAVNNIGYIFTHADTVVNVELMANFYKYNRLEYYKHTYISTLRIHNNFRPEGVRCAIGIFGIVIPTVNFNDFLLRVGPMQKVYKERPVKDINADDDLGETNIEIYHYQGDPEN